MPRLLGDLHRILSTPFHPLGEALRGGGDLLNNTFLPAAGMNSAAMGALGGLTGAVLGGPAGGLALGSLGSAAGGAEAALTGLPLIAATHAAGQALSPTDDEGMFERGMHSRLAGMATPQSGGPPGLGALAGMLGGGGKPPGPGGGAAPSFAPPKEMGASAPGTPSESEAAFAAPKPQLPKPDGPEQGDAEGKEGEPPLANSPRFGGGQQAATGMMGRMSAGPTAISQATARTPGNLGNAPDIDVDMSAQPTIQAAIRRKMQRLQGGG